MKPRDAERGPVLQGDKRHRAVVIDVTELPGERVAQPAHRREKPQPQIRRRHVRREVFQQRLVLGAQRTQVNLDAVAQPLVRFEPGRIGIL